jgi:beta-galactosidase/beta-glucuronidase
MILRMQCSFGADSSLPRDRFVIAPHFRDTNIPGGETDHQGLVDDLADGLTTWLTDAGPAREVHVVAYDAEKAPPSYPLAEAIRNANAFPESKYPREIALCLSFYSERNIPRNRGRVYIPANGLTSAASIGPRPILTERQRAAALVPLFTGLGGIDVDWGVWSRTDRAFRPVSHWFVDDEWDVQRRRGMRSTTRLEGTASE